MKRNYLLFIVFFTSGQMVLAQYPVYFPNQNSNLMQLNPGLAGSNRCTHLGFNYLLQTWKNKTTHQTFSGEFDTRSDLLHGGIGIDFNGNILNNNTNAFSTGLFYAYELPVSRSFSIKPSIRLDFTKTKTDFSDLANRYDLPGSTPLPLFYSSSLTSVSGGAGIMAFTRMSYAGVFFKNINNPIEAKMGEQAVKNPVHFSSIVGMQFYALGGNLYPIFTYESQKGKYPVDSLGIFLIDPTSYWSLNLNYTNGSVLAGAGYRRFIGQSSSYHVQAGVNLRKINLCYNIGISPFRLDDGSRTEVFYHQITLEYQLKCRARHKRFRTVSCPSFGSPGGYATSGYASFSYKSKSHINPRFLKGKMGGTTSSTTPAVSHKRFKSGTLTAGEINDFSKWQLWNDVSKKDLLQYQNIWKIYPELRYAVHVLNLEKKPVVNSTVTLYSEKGRIIWESKTDNMGKAEMWTGLFGDGDKPAYLEVKHGEFKIRQDSIKRFGTGVNTITLPSACKNADEVDILFMVDATGSMGDEIDYLKSELEDIINECKKNNPKTSLALGSLFYQCPGNAYVTKKSDFSEDVSKTIDFIKERKADGGGTEAVEQALFEGVNDFNWRATASARIIFIVLDEPPGNDNGLLKILHAAIRNASAKGIRIITLVASGYGGFDDKSLEYLMRSIALATNGTYAFLTDHSGVGNKHTAPSADEYDVEYMNKLILRLISQCMKSHCDEAPAEYVPGMKDTTLVEIIERVILDTAVYYKLPSVKNDSASAQNPKQDKNSSTTTGDTLVKKSFKFYPNPSKGKIFIECQGNIRSLYLTDMNGKMIARFPMNADGITEIDISDQIDGLYNLVYENGKKVFSGKILLIK